IAGALKKIGGYAAGSQLQTPNAPQYSHAYFSKGVGGMLQGLFATHPPLKTRIERLDPQWDGQFVVPEQSAPPGAEERAREDEAGKDTRAAAAVLSGAVAAGILSADELIGR